MDFMFVFAKAVDYLLSPLLHWALLVLWIVLQFYRGHRPHLGVVTLTIYMAVVLISPAPQWLIENLEKKHSPPQVMNLSNERRAAVVLGGGFVQYNPDLEQYFLTQSSERLIEGARLVKSGRASFLIISGATVFSRGKQFVGEAISAKHLAMELGLLEGQMAIEADSMDTAENALFSKKLLEGAGYSQFFLVTSAFHMDRSVQRFKKLGLHPIPYPVDYRVAHTQSPMFRYWGTKNIELWNTAIHEYIGQLYYAIRL